MSTSYSDRREDRVKNGSDFSFLSYGLARGVGPLGRVTCSLGRHKMKGKRKDPHGESSNLNIERGEIGGGAGKSIENVGLQRERGAITRVLAAESARGCKTAPTGQLQEPSMTIKKILWTSTKALRRSISTKKETPRTSGSRSFFPHDRGSAKGV